MLGQPGKYQESRQGNDDDENNQEAQKDLPILLRVTPSTPGNSNTFDIPRSSTEGHLHPHAIVSQDFALREPHSSPSPRGIWTPQPVTQQKPATHERTLAALSIGAPLIASVVVSCMSVVVSEIAGAFGNPPHARPTRAQATVALLWSAVITSLGSTMIAVAGLAMAAGYHDSHVGVTKTIVRRIRALRKGKSLNPARDGHHHSDSISMKSPSPCPSTATASTAERDVQHSLVALRAAEVSARLLGVSILLLATGLAVHLFTVYPRGVAVSVLIAGLATALFALLPLLPVLFPTLHHSHV